MHGGLIPLSFSVDVSRRELADSRRMKTQNLVRTAYRIGTGEDVMAPPERADRTRRLAFDSRAAAIVILTLAVLCGLVVGWTLSRPVEVHALQASVTSDSPPETTPAPASTHEAPEQISENSEPASPPPATTVTVYVSGHVNTPGLVELPAGSRVAGAVDRAGGMTAEADQNALNLARVLNDGEHIIVPAPGDDLPAPDPALSDPSLSEPSSSEGGLVSLNGASASDLETLPGIGPTLAQRIIDWRDTNGQFSSIEELMEVSGIGPATFAELRDRVTL